jgi:hypothetical protein
MIEDGIEYPDYDGATLECTPKQLADAISLYDSKYTPEQVTLRPDAKVIIDE